MSHSRVKVILGIFVVYSLLPDNSYEWSWSAAGLVLTQLGVDLVTLVILWRPVRRMQWFYIAYIIFGIFAAGMACLTYLLLNNALYVEVRECGYAWCLARGLPKLCDFSASDCNNTVKWAHELRVVMVRSAVFGTLNVRYRALAS